MSIGSLVNKLISQNTADLYDHSWVNMIFKISIKHSPVKINTEKIRGDFKKMWEHNIDISLDFWRDNGFYIFILVYSL